MDSLPNLPTAFLEPLVGLFPEEISTWLVSMGEKAYRGRQLFEAVQLHGLTAYDQATTLSKALRSTLQESGRPIHALVETAQALSQDGTRKLAYSTADGHVIETVLIPMESGSYTQCISSQAGCPLDCAFCMTGQGGFHRNLTAAEILGQHLLSLQYTGDRPIRNLVFMGMGEPLLNLENVVRAIRILNHADGRNISFRRITVSTAGFIPGIEQLAQAAPVHLAVSLNAPNQDIRAQIMPVSRRFPLPDLIAALKKWPLRPHQFMTFEYVLLPGINDSPQQALEVVRLLSTLRAKVNLIPFNPHPGSPFRRPTEQEVARFAAVLQSKHFTVTVRQSRGGDIDAACGQLAGALAGGNEFEDESDSE